jgi:translocation and assembly module TamB
LPLPKNPNGDNLDCMVNGKKVFLKAAKTVGVLVVALLASIAALFAFFQTDAGRSTLAKLITGSLSKDETRKVQIGSLSGRIPFDFQLQSLSIMDKRGPWLEVEGIRMQWSPFALLRGSFSIHELAARSVKLTRMPLEGEEVPVKAPSRPEWPGALLRLQLGRLEVERIFLGQELLGEPAVFTLEAKIGETSPTGEKETLIRLDKLDGEGASLRIRGLYRLREDTFALDARFEETRGGLVAGLLGVEGPLAFSLEGDGPARDVEAVLRAQAGGIGSIQSQVFLKMEEELQVLAKGKVRLDPTLFPEPFPQIDEELPFSLAIRIPERGIWMLDHLGLEGNGLDLEIKAAFHAEKQELEGRYKILIRDLESLRSLFKADLRGSTKVEGHFSGPFLRPRSEVHIEMTDAFLNGAGVSSADAIFQLDLLENLGSRLPRFKIAGRGAIGGLAIEHPDNFPAQNLTWELSSYGIEESRIHVSHFLLTSEGHSLRLSGSIDPFGRIGDMELSFQSDAPERLLRMTGLDLPWLGPTVLNASVHGDLGTLSVRAQFEARSKLLGRHLPGFILPQEAVVYGAGITYDQPGVLTVSRLWLEASGASLEAQGSFDLDRQSLVASWNTLLPDPALFFSIPNLSPKGSFGWSGDIEGPLSSFKISAKADAKLIEVGGVLLEGVEAGLETIYTPSMQNGDFFLEVFQGENRIKMESDFSLEGPLLHLSEISVAGLESSLAGKATLDLETSEVQGEMRGNVSELSSLLSLLGQEIRGSAKLEATFRIGGEDQHLAFSLEAGSLAGPFAEARDLQIKSRIEGTMAHMDGFLNLEIREARISELTISSLAFKGKGLMDRASFQLDVSGHYGENFEATSSGTFTLSNNVQRLFLERFQARYGPAPATLSLALLDPTSVIHERGALRLEESAFAVGAGSLRGSGTYISSHVDFHLHFEDLPLEVARLAGAPGLKGKASGSLLIEGHPERPKAAFELFAVGLGLEEAQFQDLPETSLDLKGSFSDQRLKANLAFRGLTPDPLRASAEFPLYLSFAPLTVAMDSQGAMKIDLHGEVPLPHVAALLGLHDQALAGRAEATLRVLGTVESPRVTGMLRLSEGAYENFRTGTILKEVTLLLAAENGRLVIQDAGATDGEKGSITVNGWFDFSPAEDFPFQVDIALRDAVLIRHDSFTATARGDLVFAGTRKGALLSGEVALYPLEVRIPSRLPPEIAYLEIIEIHEEETETPAPETRKPPGDSFAEMRVTVVIPGRAHLSGRGLDSEWQGRLEVQGPVGNPSISGELSVVRGHFNFLGKRFNLTRGLVSFLGDAPPSPVLSITAESSTREMTAFLELSGKVDSPDLRLTSQPSLPDDEVLSRLLFGRSVTQITPLQALQLAHALDVLAGRRGFDLMDHTRRMLGLDLLEIRDLGVEMDEAALRAGKYLAENVYIEVEQGLGPESGRASLQWEITPNITVQTEVGINAEAGAGIRWKWDY